MKVIVKTKSISIITTVSLWLAVALVWTLAMVRREKWELEEYIEAYVEEREGRVLESPFSKGVREKVLVTDRE